MTADLDNFRVDKYTHSDMYPSVSIQPQTVNASQLQRASGKILRRVAVQKENLIVESNGYPIVALIPYAEYEQWKRERARAEMLSFMDEQARLSKKAGLDTVSDEEAMADALKAIEEVRRGKRKKQR